MKQYTLKQITYKVTTSMGQRNVLGFAIDLDLPVRICTRQNSNDEWIFDDFDTGFSIPVRHTNITEALALCFNLLDKKIADGAYQRGQAEAFSILKKMGIEK